jgi:mannose-6-phosphate isomerase-like protein (cupin superfamily)
MPVVTTHEPGLAEDQMIAQMAGDGFEAAAKDYFPGKTEPHHHEYDVCLYILEGEFSVAEVSSGQVHRFVPGDKVFVPRGTAHAEEHGALRMVVGRRY